MTLSRGPWVAWAAAALIIFLCRTKKRRRAVVWAAAASIVAAVPVSRATMAYVSMRRQNTSTRLQQNAAYRYELAERYLPLVAQHPVWGWGLRTCRKLAIYPQSTISTSFTWR